jgi:hypothetical protein
MDLSRNAMLFFREKWNFVRSGPFQGHNISLTGGNFELENWEVNSPFQGPSE